MTTLASASPYAVGAIGLVLVATVLQGLVGLPGSRTTSDFFVASRRVGARRNAAAISGEYLSAASFLGAAGLIYSSGVDLVWLPVGYTVGFVVLLLFVAAPLRRSGAYTLPDFAEARLESRTVRLTTSVLVVAVGWLYLVAQLVGAAAVFSALTGAPRTVGAALVAAVVVVVVGSGGMRSITGIQSVQYFVKLACLALPVLVMLGVWLHDGLPAPRVDLGTWAIPFTGGPGRPHPVYATWSTLLAFSLGTMGLPHVVIRYYTNPDGAAARRTTVTVIALLGAFYVLVPPLGVLGAVYLPTLPHGTTVDTMPLQLPAAVVGGVGGELLTALLAGGAFIAFCSTSSGLAVAVAGVLEQDLVGGIGRRLPGGHSPVRGFRVATVIALLVPLALVPVMAHVAVARLVELAFTLTSATLSPLLLLGVWWPRLSRAGALAGLLAGTLLAGGATLAGAVLHLGPGWPATLLARPTAWATPLTVLVIVLVSRLTPGGVPRDTHRTLVRLHTPEVVHLDRSAP